MLSGANSRSNYVEEAKELLQKAELMQEAIKQMLLVRKSLGLEVSNDDLKISLKANADVTNMRNNLAKMTVKEAELTKLRDKLAKLVDNQEEDVTKASADNDLELIAAKPQNTQESQSTVPSTAPSAVFFQGQTLPSSLLSGIGMDNEAKNSLSN